MDSISSLCEHVTNYIHKVLYNCTGNGGVKNIKMEPVPVHTV